MGKQGQGQSGVAGRLSAAVTAAMPAVAGARTRTRTPPGGQVKSPKTSKGPGSKCFEAYKTSDNHMGAEGVQKLFEDLGVDPTDPVALVLAYHCGAQTMGEFTEAEFQRGLGALGCNTMLQLKAKIPALRQELLPGRSLQKIYAFTFEYTLDEGTRRIPVELAVALWGMLLPPATFPHMGPFLAWMGEKEEYVKRDLWSEVWSFATTVKPDLSNYDDNPAWPVLLDEYVETQRGA